MSESKRGWMPQLKWRANTPFLSLWFQSTLNSGLDNAPPTLAWLKSGWESNAKVFQKHPHRHIRNNGLPSNQASLNPVNFPQRPSNTRLKGQQRLSEAIGGSFWFLCRQMEGRVDWRTRKLKKRRYKELFWKKTKDTGRHTLKSYQETLRAQLRLEIINLL